MNFVKGFSASLRDNHLVFLHGPINMTVYINRFYKIEPSYHSWHNPTWAVILQSLTTPLFYNYLVAFQRLNVLTQECTKYWVIEVSIFMNCLMNALVNEEFRGERDHYGEEKTFWKREDHSHLWYQASVTPYFYFLYNFFLPAVLS